MTIDIIGTSAGDNMAF